MRNFFYKKLFYYHYQLPDKPTKIFFKKVFKARTLIRIAYYNLPTILKQSMVMGLGGRPICVYSVHTCLDAVSFPLASL